jgi:hypothetical protein
MEKQKAVVFLRERKLGAGQAHVSRFSRLTEQDRTALLALYIDEYYLLFTGIAATWVAPVSRRVTVSAAPDARGPRVSL